MIQPFVDLCESQLAESDASEDRRVRTSHALWVWKLAGQTPREQIQHALFVFVEFFLVAQNLPVLAEVVILYGTAKFTVRIRMHTTCLPSSTHLPYPKRAASLRRA